MSSARKTPKKKKPRTEEVSPFVAASSPYYNGIRNTESQRDKNLRLLTSEKLFEHLHAKISTKQQPSNSFGDSRVAQLQLLLGFMREDTTFLLIMQEMERIRENDYLLTMKSPTELLNKILKKIKLAMEAEYQRMQRLWEGSIGLLS